MPERRPTPEFQLDDFVQDSRPSDPPHPSEAPDADATFTWTTPPDTGPAPAPDDDFTWFQDAIEQESEDIAAWGASQDSGEPFVWYQDAREAPAAAQLGPAVTTPEAASGKVASAEKPIREPHLPTENAPVTQKKTHFRPEIEGLRAVAVFMIVVYHVWLGRVSGGVDVFLFISAFLLGSSFARRLDAGGTFHPVKYWLRTFTRLMPPAVIAIVGTLIGAYFVLPPSAWQMVITHAISSATYVQNIVLSVQSVDYYTLDASHASPLQHFWSLSLQGQVFLTWPLLFMGVALLARRSQHPRVVAFAVFALIAAASFAYSVWFTATNQNAAYFSTPARLWEVSAGTLLALALPSIDRILGAQRPGNATAPRHRTLRALAGWAGFVLLVSLGVTLDVQGIFPGWIAIWPLTAAALIIVAGYSGSRWGFDRILTMKLPRTLASSSYSLYLVHWPILILWLAYSGQSRAGMADGFAVIAVSLLVAWVVSKAVDAQFRSPVWKAVPAWRSLAVIGVCLMLVVGTSLTWRTALAREATQATVVTKEDPAPATTSVLDAAFDADTISPKGYELGSQWPSMKYSCAGQKGAPPTKKNVPCQTLTPLSTDTDFLVIVVGSSHARQFIPTMLSTAREKNWQILNLSMDGCTFVKNPKLGPYCKGYYEHAIAQIRRMKPDLVVTTATAAQPGSPTEGIPAGGREAIRDVLALGIDVLAFRDPPRWSDNAYTCAEEVVRDGGTPDDVYEECGAPRATKLAAKNPLDSLEGLEEEAAAASAASDSGGASPAAPGTLYTMDLTEEICPEDRCSPIRGNAYVYMDDNHLSRVFTTALAPVVARRLEELGVGTGQ